MIWNHGAGDYGEGWGASGKGVTVRQGDTVYIKYYADTAGGALAYAEHGRTWGWWRTAGPAIEAKVGCGSSNPVILRISNIGTPSSTASWVNGTGTSGLWSAFTAPGPYDLGLAEDAQWTNPPLVVRERSLFERLFGPLSSGSAGGGGDKTSNFSEPTIHDVPEQGGTLALFGAALISLAWLRRKLR